MAERKLYAVVLAAGSGRRFGSTKQLARIGGRAMVARAVANAASACGPRVVLVAGDAWQEVLACARLEKGFFVVNTGFASGLSGSIAAGIRGVTGPADAVLLMLADQPLVTPGHLRRLEAAWRASPDAIVSTAYANTCGPPVIFPARDFAALAALEGDRGAKSVIDANKERVTAVRFEDAGIDIDTPADLEKLRKRSRQSP